MWWVFILLFVHLTNKLASIFNCTFYHAFTLSLCNISKHSFCQVFVLQHKIQNKWASWFLLWYPNRECTHIRILKATKSILKGQQGKWFLFFAIWVHSQSKEPLNTRPKCLERIRNLSHLKHGLHILITACCMMIVWISKV